MEKSRKRNPDGTSVFDDREAEIVRLIREGGTVTEAAKAVGIDKATLFRWLGDPSRQEFRDNYAGARVDQADAFVDEIIDVARDRSREPAQARLQVDALKWAAGKRKPKVYGDKLELASDPDNPIVPKEEVRSMDLARAMLAIVAKAEQEPLT